MVYFLSGLSLQLSSVPYTLHLNIGRKSVPPFACICAGAAVSVNPKETVMMKESKATYIPRGETHAERMNILRLASVRLLIKMNLNSEMLDAAVVVQLSHNSTRETKLCFKGTGSTLLKLLARFGRFIQSDLHTSADLCVPSLK